MSAIVLPSLPPSGTGTPKLKITVRPRSHEDVPALSALLERQQPHSLYPIVWPLPIPVERFIERPGERAALVAETSDGKLLGHIAVRYGQGGPPEEEELTARWAEAHGCREEDVRVISVLFTDPDYSGMGVGSSLMRAAFEAACEDGGRPCLDVVEENADALNFYKRRGWKIIGEWSAPWNPGKITNVFLMIYPIDGDGTGKAAAAVPASSA